MKVFASLLGRLSLLVAVTFFLWTGVFYSLLYHAPQYTVATVGKYDGRDITGPVEWSEITKLSEDGTQIEVFVHKGTLSFSRRYDVRSGKQAEATVAGELSDSMPDQFQREPVVARSVDQTLAATVDSAQHKLTIWHVPTSRRQAEVPYSLSDGQDNEYRFSSDGRQLFAYRPFSAVYWWETASGSLCRVAETDELLIHEPAGAVITHQVKIQHLVGTDDHKFQIWDIKTGQHLAECTWGENVPEDVPACGMVSSPAGAYLAMVFDPDYGHTQGRAMNLQNRKIVDKRGAPERAWVSLIDLRTRREITLFPGRSARFSPSGEWLATLDDEGNARVWRLPLRPPWRAILATAGFATLLSWTVILPTAWAVRRYGLPRIASPRNRLFLRSKGK
jgi:WD40 repeat protein